jgi:hypothetical protein
LFALRQSLAAFHYYQQLVIEVDQEIQRQLSSLETAITAEPAVPKRTKASPYKRGRYEPKAFDLRHELYLFILYPLSNRCEPAGAQNPDGIVFSAVARKRCEAILATLSTAICDLGIHLSVDQLMNFWLEDVGTSLYNSPTLK